MRTVTIEQRRAILVERHLLAGGGRDAEQVVDALLALHATDAASVYLSVLARSRASTVADVAAAMYERRSIVRWRAMRRPLCVFARVDVPMIQAAISTPLAGALRRRLLSRLTRNGLVPPVEEDLAGWLAAVEARVDAALEARGSATGADLRADVPELGSSIPARIASEQTQSLTSPLLTLMSAEGRLIRSTPIGAWTTRNHRWEPTTAWWPEGLPALEPAEAEVRLARRWLERFGPATIDDLEWWTGWTKGTTRAALTALEPQLEEVDLHGVPGIDLRDAAPVEPAAPVAALLPALDPTPMGWTHRDWFTAVDPALIYDRVRNIGPTAWWDGELVGSWATTSGGIRIEVVADRGAAAVAALEAEAHRLEALLGGANVVPAARTPSERRLSAAT